MAKKSKDEWGNAIELPDIPTPQQATPTKPVSEYPLSDYNKWYNEITQVQNAQYPDIIKTQLGVMPDLANAYIGYEGMVNPAMTQLDIQRNMAMLPADLRRQQAMMGGAFSEQTREAGLANQFQLGEAQKYGQQYTDLFNQFAQSSNPEFMNTYNLMAQNTQQGLQAGYSLGADLEREINQTIRGGQADRGNYLGPAATAQEAYGTGEAAVNLYGQRMAQGQSFLNGKQPTDLWGSMGLSMPNMQMPQVQNAYMPDTSGGAALSGRPGPEADWAQNIGQNPEQVLPTMASYNQMGLESQAAFNTAGIQATQVNNQGMFDAYDKAFDQFLYNESVAHGLYDTPAAPSTGGQQAGAIVGGVASAASAASAAAAAFCWLARRVIPSRWMEWREWIFTKAPAWFRRKYIYGAKALAATITDEEAIEIGSLMTQCLQKR